MIIASPNAQSPSPSAKVDTGPGANRSAPTAEASSDTPVEATHGFGRILAQRLDGGGASDVAKPGDKDAFPVDGTKLFAADGQPLATTHGLPGADAAAADADVAPSIGGAVLRAGPVASKAGAVTSDATAGKPDRKAGDASAGDDLASQLALVSQWAALPPAGAAATPGDAKADGLDIKGKLDAVRVASTKADPAASKQPVAIEAAPVVVAPFVSSSVQSAGDRTPRGTATSATVTKAADLKAKDDEEAVVGDRLSPGDALLGKVDTAAAHGQTDATALANAFVTQVTSQVSHAQAAAAATVVPAPTLHETVGTPAWAHEVGQATLRIAANDLQGASLRLNPEHLGPLDVQVRVDNGVAHLAFSAAHAETRQAIESSRTTLDQLFADQGLKIGDCAVGDSSSQRRFDAEATPGGTQRDGQRWGQANDGAVDSATPTVTTTVMRALGLVDTFA